MKKRLLNRVKERILAAPSKFDMGQWGWEQIDAPPCGTACCIAGWLTREAKRPAEDAGTSLVAALLDVSVCDAIRLCYTDEWPLDLAARYHRAKTAPARARVGAERIDRFIATKGAE